VSNKLRHFTSSLNTISPTIFFSGAALLTFLLYNFFTPPLQAPDELSHLYRTYQVSEGIFVAQKSNNRVGGTIPFSVTDFALPVRLVSTSEHKLNQYDYNMLLRQEVRPEVRTFRDFPNTAQYTPLSYAPQAITFFILRNLGTPVIIQYYGARAAAFFCWFLFVFAAIRIIPICKWLFVLLAMLPMNVYLSNSLSADTMTNGLAFLLIAYVLRLAFSAVALTWKQCGMLAVLCFCLALAKVVYIPLILILFAIPANRFSTTINKYIFITVVFSACTICVLWWSTVVMTNYLPDYAYNPVHRNDATVGFHADFHRQKKYLLDHPVQFVKVMFNTIFYSPQPYLKSYIGFFGAFQDLVMPDFVYWISWGGILFISFFSGNSEFTMRNRLIFVLAALTAFACVLLSQYLTWDQVGSGIVGLMQGRYLIPIIPLLLAAIIGVNKFNIALPAVVTFLVLLLNGAGAVTLYHRYVRINYEDSAFFHSSMEEVDASGKIVTSHPAVALAFNNNLTHKDARTGKTAAISSAQFPYILGCDMEGMSAGDLVEIEVWMKGKGASLVLTGGLKECGDFYVANNFPDYTDHLGWEHVHMQYRLPGHCSDILLHFLIHNPGDSMVLIDDISFTVRRGIKQ
jgi:uncharacterized membrane protein